MCFYETIPRTKQNYTKPLTVSASKLKIKVVLRLTFFKISLKSVFLTTVFNPLSAKFIKWSNTLKQIVGKLPTICLSVFDHFSGLALKELTQ